MRLLLEEAIAGEQRCSGLHAAHKYLPPIQVGSLYASRTQQAWPTRRRTYPRAPDPRLALPLPAVAFFSITCSSLFLRPRLAEDKTVSRRHVRVEALRGTTPRSVRVTALGKNAITIIKAGRKVCNRRLLAVLHKV